MLPSFGAAAVVLLLAADSPTVSSGDPAEAEAGQARARISEEILVTGSRIRRKDLHTPAPVTVITREDLVASGVSTVGDLLQQSPFQANAPNAQYNNGGDGTIRVALRGLDERRTLVLLDGRRFVAGGNGANAGVDLGAIPAAAVERIELLRDGASPIYGTDAVAGVVNIITRKRWSGTEASALAGSSSRGDGQSIDLSLTTGLTGETGSLLVAAGFSEQRALWSGSRPWGTTSWAYDFTGGRSPTGTVGPYAVGSGARPGGRVFAVAGPGPLGTFPNPAADPRIDLYNQLITTYPAAESFVPDPASPLGWRPWAGDSLPQYGGDQYNVQPDNYLVTPAQRLSLFASGDARLGEWGRVVFQGSYVSRASQQKLAPEPLNLAGDGITISASNRYNPFGVDLTDVRGRLVGLGNRTFRQDIDTLRAVGGVEGSLPAAAGPLAGWAWEVVGVFGRSEGSELTTGYTRKSLLAQALGPSFNYGTAANPDWGCGTGPSDRIPGCAPIDLFSTSGTASLASLSYDGVARGTNELSSVQLNLSGELFPLLSERRAGLAAGYEYRQVAGSYTPDPIKVAGDSSTDGSVQHTRGAQDVHEAYAELALPIAEGAPLAEVVEATAAARAFRYRGFSADWAWKLGARWKPLPDVTLRGTASTAYRAPSVAELHTGAWSRPAQGYDPCAGVDSRGNPEPVSPWCGAAANNGQQDPVVTVTDEGNPRLLPEQARVYTLGMVLEPRFAPRLAVAVDLYAVSIDQAIQALPDPVGGCYPMSASVTPLFCEYLRRDPVTQAITALRAVPVNAGSERVAGVDLSARYALPTSVGRFSLSFDGTWLRRHDLVRADGSTLHFAGNYDYPSEGALSPTWRFNAGAAWRRGTLGAALDVRYLGSVKECFDERGLSTLCSFDHTYSRQTARYAAWNAHVTYDLSTSAGKTSLLLGVRNLLDTPPPRIYWGPYASSDPGYDFVGRYFYVRLAQRI